MTRAKTPLAETFRISRDVSVTAQEERLRSGHPAIDVDHLFLALLVVGGPAAALLTEHGISLQRAREAVAAVHRAQVASLGITVPPTPPRRMQPDSEGVEFTDRALTVMQRTDPVSYQLEILVALLDEPSGHLDQVLAELGVSESALRTAALAQVDRLGSARPAASEAVSRWPEVSFTGYVPAPPAAVFGLLSDPHRRSEWSQPHHGRVEVDPAGGVTTFYQPDPPAIGLKRRLSWLRSDHTVVEAEPDRLMAWSTVLTGHGRRRGQSGLSVELAPEGVGTRLIWRCVPPALPRLALARSFWRWAVRQHLTSLNAGVSRTLR